MYYVPFELGEGPRKIAVTSIANIISHVYRYVDSG